MTSWLFMIVGIILLVFAKAAPVSHYEQSALFITSIILSSISIIMLTRNWRKR